MIHCSVLGFDVTVEHPNTYVVKCAQLVKGELLPSKVFASLILFNLNFLHIQHCSWHSAAFEMYHLCPCAVHLCILISRFNDAYTSKAEIMKHGYKGLLDIFAFAALIGARQVWAGT